MNRLAVAFASSIVLLACTATVTPVGGGSSGDPGPSLGTPTGTSTTDPPAKPPEKEAGADAAPNNTPLFALTLGGKTVTPTKLTAEKHGVGGMTGVKGEVAIDAELPKGAQDSSVPRLDVNIYTPLQGKVPYSAPNSTRMPNSAYVQYHYSRPGLSGFPKAVGAGCTIARDGRDGWFEATCSGTFDIDDQDVSFTLEVRQAVEAMP